MARKKFTMDDDTSPKIVSLPASSACDNKIAFAERLKLLRIRSGISAKDLADALNISLCAVYNWESGRTRPDIANITGICRALRISVSELFSDEKAISDITETDKETIRKIRSLSEPHRKHVMNMIDDLYRIETEYGMTMKYRSDIIVIPYASTALAAGYAFPETAAEATPCYLYENSLTQRADYVFRVSGESMEPSFHDGDSVLIQKAEREQIRQGDICAFITDGSLYIKEYRRDGLYSHNPAYPPMYFREYEEVKIIGRVLGTITDKDCATSEEIRLYNKNHGDN